MKTPYKPFRLINAKELAYFQQNFNQHLEVWNQLYAKSALQLELALAPKPKKNSPSLALEEFALLQQGVNPVALLGKNYLLALKKSLFADTSACFDSCSDLLFMNLVKPLLAVDSLGFVKDLRTALADWFYPGSPSLQLNFSNEDCFFTMYLHPNWILNHLPKSQRTSQAIGKLDPAIAEQKIDLTLELKPLQLSLNKLLDLQIGDVIKTSHFLNDPLLLCFQQRGLCEVKIGQYQHHKTIQLTRHL